MRAEELLKQPEGKTLEFKRDISAPKNILKTVIAFANTAGGTVVVGRADDGTIVGVDDVLDAEERLANLIADSIAPGMMPEIEAVTVANKALLLIRVAHRIESGDRFFKLTLFSYFATFLSTQQPQAFMEVHHA